MIDKIELPCKLCPICQNSLPEYARGLTYHARSHQISPEELFCAIFSRTPQLCNCGCGEYTKWLGWKQLDYSMFKLGHEVRTANGKASRSLTLKQAYSSGKQTHWTRDHDTSKVSAIFQNAGKKISQKLIDGYKSGLYTHWLKKDNVKETEAYKRWQNSIEKSRPKNNKHWKFMSSDITLNRIKSSIGERFVIDTESVNNALDCKENNRTTILSLTCSRCQSVIQRSIFNVIRGNLMCQSCDRNFTSYAEKEIAEFINTLGFDVRKNDKCVLDGHELDVYIPQKKFAIEFNGLYWHSTFVNPRKNYHDDKRRMCIKKEITLFNIFEDEWRDKRHIITSMIAHRLGVTPKTIFARSCKVTTKSRDLVVKFLNDNHVDGNVRFTDSICLEFDNEIVAVATFRTPFHKKWKSMLELARFCTKINTHIPGALSKLTNQMIKQSKERQITGLLTYIDTRFGSDESCYIKSGWSSAEETGIRWWWTDKVKRYDRFKYRASKSKNLTELQVASSAGVAKLFGTTQLRLIKMC